MPRYRLLALDIDGTLVNGRDELTDHTCAALARAAAAGIRVVLVTGRQYSRTLGVARDLDLSTPVVTACGALVKNPADHRTLFRAQFLPGVLTELLAIIHHAGYDPVVYTDDYTQGFEYHYPEENGRQPRAELAEFIELNRERGRACADLVAKPPADALAGFAIGPREPMERLETDLSRRLPDRLYTHVMRSPRYVGYMCEILPAGVSKWTGVRRVAAAWGIADDVICAVGDDVNDIPMLRGAGLGVAMGNAAEHVQRHADRVCPRNDDDGLVEVVRWILDDA